MSFFSLWVAARELSLGVGAAVEEEEEEDEEAIWWGEADEEGVARLEVDEEEADAVWRAFKALLLGLPFWVRA